MVAVAIWSFFMVICVSFVSGFPQQRYFGLSAGSIPSTRQHIRVCVVIRTLRALATVQPFERRLVSDVAFVRALLFVAAEAGTTPSSAVAHGFQHYSRLQKKNCDVAKCEWGVGSRSDPRLWHSVRGGGTPRDWEALWEVERPTGTAPVPTAEDGVAIAFDTVCLWSSDQGVSTACRALRLDSLHKTPIDRIWQHPRLRSGTLTY